MSALRSPHADPAQPTLRQRGVDLKAGIARVLRRQKPTEAESAPSGDETPVETIEHGAEVREAAADALSDDRVSPDLRAAIEARRDAVVAMLIEADTRDETTDRLTAAVYATDDALRAVPARSIADVRAKLAFLLPEVLPDVNGTTPTAFIENIFDDVEWLAAQPVDGADPMFAAVAVARRAEAAAEAFERENERLTTPSQRKQERALSDASFAARQAVYATTPTTQAGRRALVGFIRFEAELIYGADWLAHVHTDMLGDSLLSLMAAVEAERPAADAARPGIQSDLSNLSLNDLAHLHATASTLWTNTSMYLNAPFAWDGKRMNYGPLGRIIEAEANRLEALARAAAEEAARRQPQDDGERDRRLEVAVQHAMLGGGPIEDPEVVAEINTAWGR